MALDFRLALATREYGLGNLTLWSTLGNVDVLKLLISCLIIIPYDNLVQHFMIWQKERLIPFNVMSMNKKAMPAELDIYREW